MAHMRKILALVALLLLGAPAAAQIPQFPQTLPPNTVLGRIGQGVAGPVEAIPFATFQTFLSANFIIGSSTVLSGVNGRILYDNAGIVSEYSAAAATTYIASGSGGGTTNFLRADGTWAAPPGGGGSGTVTSVGLTMPAIFSVANSPVTTTGTLAVTASGTSGGIPYFNAATTMASSGVLSANNPVIGGGAGTAPTVGSRSGN